MTTISRRDFLKISGTVSLSAYLSPVLQISGEKKVLILVFDAMSARHLSLYGYPRETTPELSRFADRATVYHAHYATANITSPSTASLFLGMYPWNHRAYLGGGLIRRDLVAQNLFARFGKDFYRFAFAQTEFANILMDQLASSIDRKLPPYAFSIGQSPVPKTANSKLELLETFTSPTLLQNYLGLAKKLALGDHLLTGFPEYPNGVPVIADNGTAFQLEDVYDGALREIQTASASTLPHLSYYHLFAPHNPYKPGRNFIDLFKDSFRPEQKPEHPLSTSGMSYRNMLRSRRTYDQYIAQVDHEFGRLVNRLEADGALDDTYVIVTSDHGELFERATTGHAVPLLFESVVHVPLLIRAPAQEARVDIHARTSTVDLYPTLLNLFGKAIPAGTDGELLPGFGGQGDPGRTLYSMFSHSSSAFAPIRKGTFSMLEGDFKLIYYRGYKEYPEAYELYHLKDDPEEMHDLFARNPSVAGQMKEHLLSVISQADAAFE